MKIKLNTALLIVLIIFACTLLFYLTFDVLKKAEKAVKRAEEAIEKTEEQKKEEEEPTFIEWLKSQDVDIVLTGNGRYQIHHNPISAKFTFLVDTRTGKVWQTVRDPETSEYWWRETPVEK